MDLLLEKQIDFLETIGIDPYKFLPPRRTRLLPFSGFPERDKWYFDTYIKFEEVLECPKERKRQMRRSLLSTSVR